MDVVGGTSSEGRATAATGSRQPGPSADQDPPRSGTRSRGYVRGSTLLLAGRFVSLLLNSAVQVLTVRYLSKSDYGAFAYAVGMAALGSSTVLAGIGKAVPRLVPIYHERKDYARTFGAITLAVGIVLALGVSVVLLVHGFQGVLGRRIVGDARSLSLVLILIALVPVDALDNLLQKLVAIFASPAAIFFRRHVVGPSLKLAVVLLVLQFQGNVRLLVYGYVAGGLLGVSLYVPILAREWRREGVLQHLKPSRMQLPARELLGFSVPLVSSELSVISRSGIVLVVLQYWHSAAAVAEYRAVLPIAALNLVVFEAFGFLFVPLASRMFAKNEDEAISDLYWQTSVWIALLTLPVFVATCALAQPLTILFFGEAYATAGTVLALLAVGHYFSAALGFNAATLRVLTDGSDSWSGAT